MAQDFDALLRHYARKDVQEAMIDLAKDREVTGSYNMKSFGRRPDILQYPSDIFELARKGVTSFHVSEERWSNPLEIRTGMSKKELDQIRCGWDCVLDIDSPYIEYSQITTYLLIEALKLYGLKSFGVKFSGRKGFHILIPFGAFPKEVGGRPIETMFPEGPRMIADFLGEKIYSKLSEMILKDQNIEDISKLTKKPMEEITDTNGNFNPFSVVDIDTILISSRHLFRSVYSINEKSWLVSIPIDPEKLNDFKLRDAKIENVKTDILFFKIPEEDEARSLVIAAFDKSREGFIAERKSTIVMEGKDYFGEESNKKEFKIEEIDNTLVKEEYFPPCIKSLLDGTSEDGRKRSLFVLMNFFKGLNFPQAAIKEKIDEWNKKNYEPLREGYVISQLSSLMRSSSTMPPNCKNDAYYSSLRVCNPDNFCQKIKNPLQYTSKKIWLEKLNKKNAKKKTTKKVVKKASKKQKK